MASRSLTRSAVKALSTCQAIRVSPRSYRVRCQSSLAHAEAPILSQQPPSIPKQPDDVTSSYSKPALATSSTTDTKPAAMSHPDTPANAPWETGVIVSGPQALYTSLVNRGQLNDDAHQRVTVKKLQELYDRLKGYSPPTIQSSEGAVESDGGVFSMFSSMFASKAPERDMVIGPRGLYLWGDVGTGKTMTMDLFYSSCAITRKRRVHFHAFMQDVHRRVHQLRQSRGIGTDPIPYIADELASNAFLLCFDELQVTDITDAMILRRLFTELFNRGVVMVTTSNRPPDELYKNGIQRSSFIPAIELLKERCEVHTLNSGVDYRKQKRDKYRVFLYPNNSTNSAHLDSIWRKMVGDHIVEEKVLYFLGRSMTLPESTPTAARISFEELCGQPHSAADYLEIAKSGLRTLVVTDVPKMTLKHRNEARRFITLLDALYESHMNLVMLTDAPLHALFSSDDPMITKGVVSDHQRQTMDDLKLTPEQMSSPIFSGSEEVFAFQRALSRLMEMQSVQWIGHDLKEVLTEVAADED
ncbi:hypothetical protein SmJEL517_g03918 [Synchytrium microbalum]|uniref:AAA+ ATPase domain-containing protein n=1 Tax=Synchytrium microbalum TaxID=1806994 RepID=A0A507C0X9_9FUNG|nr:uncharacterized protein SmJEL517_g03918 [Synchytrium microbalum]TPX33071.1 hypothetical protein SmJEL517_g03918 [Synchytrium microbalum]